MKLKFQEAISMFKVKEVKEYIRKRLREFEILGRDGEVIFDFNPFLNLKIRSTPKLELAFCISVANEKALNGLKFQSSISEEELKDETKVRKKLKLAGIRFFNTKSKYISSAVKHFDEVIRFLDKDEIEAREFLVKNIKGLGFKEASHFLRNLGKKNLAILDRHILRFLEREKIIKNSPKNLTRRKYFELESILKEIAKDRKMSPAELDLHIWYRETKMILK